MIAFIIYFCCGYCCFVENLASSALIPIEGQFYGNYRQYLVSQTEVIRYTEAFLVLSYLIPQWSYIDD